MIVHILEHLQRKRYIWVTLDWWPEGRGEGRADRDENKRNGQNKSKALPRTMSVILQELSLTHSTLINT